MYSGCAGLAPGGARAAGARHRILIWPQVGRGTAGRYCGPAEHGRPRLSAVLLHTLSAAGLMLLGDAGSARGSVQKVAH
eukprot:SAG31_NODE_696_length_12754_cov_9.480759_1_plen_79_part_00